MYEYYFSSGEDLTKLAADFTEGYGKFTPGITKDDINDITVSIECKQSPFNRTFHRIDVL